MAMMVIIAPPAPIAFSLPNAEPMTLAYNKAQREIADKATLGFTSRPSKVNLGEVGDIGLEGSTTKNADSDMKMLWECKKRGKAVDCQTKKKKNGRSSVRVRTESQNGVSDLDMNTTLRPSMLLWQRKSKVNASRSREVKVGNNFKVIRYRQFQIWIVDLGTPFADGWLFTEENGGEKLPLLLVHTPS
jgi:hypothetical protein